MSSFVSTSLVSGDVRTHNLSLLMRRLVDAGPSARSELAAATGLARGSVTALVGALADSGLVRETEVVQGEGAGRPKIRLTVAADTVALLAMQIDADQAICLAHDLAGAELFRVSAHHGRPMGDPEAVLDVAARVLGDTLTRLDAEGRDVAGLTVVMLAPVAGEPRIVLADTDLGWGPVDVLAGLREREPRLPRNTTLTSDGLAALAEASLLTGVTDMLYLKSNSGIGGAIIAGGELLQGSHLLGGALGHIAVDYDGAQCDCGQRGCLVTVAGPDVVLTRAGLAPVLESEGLTRALELLVDRVRSGDPEATEAFTVAADWVARAIAILRMTLDPEIIVLGGYWAELSDLIGARAAVRMWLAGPDDVTSAPPVVRGRLGADAALLGALWQLRDVLLADPLALAPRSSRERN